VLAAPSPTLPRKRERERTEIAGTGGESSLPFIPAQAGIQEPWSVALGPRFRGDERSELFRGDQRNFCDYIATTLLTTYRAYARQIRIPAR
jgi:hypothetical protein